MLYEDNEDEYAQYYDYGPDDEEEEGEHDDQGRGEMETRRPYPLSFHLLDPRHLLTSYFGRRLRPPTLHAQCLPPEILLTMCKCRRCAATDSFS